MHLNIANKSESSDKKFQSQKLLIDRFLCSFADDRERFRPRELSKARTDFHWRVHVFGDRNWFENSQRLGVQSAKLGWFQRQNHQKKKNGSRKSWRSRGPSTENVRAEERDLLRSGVRHFGRESVSNWQNSLGMRIQIGLRCGAGPVSKLNHVFWCYCNSHCLIDPQWRAVKVTIILIIKLR